jgi:hypothetical protein
VKHSREADIDDAFDTRFMPAAAAVLHARKGAGGGATSAIEVVQMYNDLGTIPRNATTIADTCGSAG